MAPTMPDTEDQPMVSEQGVALNSATATLSGLPSVVDRDPVLLEIECYGISHGHTPPCRVPSEATFSLAST